MMTAERVKTIIGAGLVLGLLWSLPAHAAFPDNSYACQALTTKGISGLVRVQARNVEKASPKEIETAMGIRNCACKEVSKSNGVRPAKVVRDVRIIALKRIAAPRAMASLALTP